MTIALMLTCSIAYATEPTEPPKAPALFGLCDNVIMQDQPICESGFCPMPTNASFGMQTYAPYQVQSAPRVQRTYWSPAPKQNVSYQQVQTPVTTIVEQVQRVPVTTMVEKTIQVPMTQYVEQTVSVPMTTMQTECQAFVCQTSAPMMMTTTRTRRVGFFTGFFERIRQKRSARMSARQQRYSMSAQNCY